LSINSDSQLIGPDADSARSRARPRYGGRQCDVSAPRYL